MVGERIEKSCRQCPGWEGFVNDITAFMEGQNKELPGIAESVLMSMRREVEEKGLELSIMEGKKENAR